MIGHVADADAGVDVFLQIRASVSLPSSPFDCLLDRFLGVFGERGQMLPIMGPAVGLLWFQSQLRLVLAKSMLVCLD